MELGEGDKSGGNLKNRVTVLLSVCLLTLSSLVVAVAEPCACGIPIPPIPTPTPTPSPTVNGSIAFAGLYNGAPFTWERWIKPIIHISQNGTTTTVTVENGLAGQVAGVSKFIFKNDLYTWNSKNKISPDVSELQKVLVAENLLGANSQTGVYDETTKAAVAAFQKKYNIHPAPIYPYGYFGPITRAFQNAR